MCIALTPGSRDVINLGSVEGENVGPGASGRQRINRVLAIRKKRLGVKQESEGEQQEGKTEACNEERGRNPLLH